MFESLKLYGGSLSAAECVAYFVPEAPEQQMVNLQRIGVEVREIQPPHPGSPWANKLAAFEEPASFDWLVLVDTDALVVGDFSGFLQGGALRACSVHAPDAPTIEQWRKLFDMFGLELPGERLRSSVTHELTVPSLATGIMLVPAPLVEQLRTAWGEIIESMVARRDEIRSLTGFQWGGGDQIPLTLALSRGLIEFDLLPIKMLFPTNGRFPASAEANDIDPLIVHPTRRRTRYGSIGPSGYKAADARIAEANRALGLGPTRLDQRVLDAVNAYRLSGRPALLHRVLAGRRIREAAKAPQP